MGLALLLVWEQLLLSLLSLVGAGAGTGAAVLLILSSMLLLLLLLVAAACDGVEGGESSGEEKTAASWRIFSAFTNLTTPLSAFYEMLMLDYHQERKGKKKRERRKKLKKIETLLSF